MVKPTLQNRHDQFITNMNDDYYHPTVGHRNSTETDGIISEKLEMDNYTFHNHQVTVSVKASMSVSTWVGD